MTNWADYQREEREAVDNSALIGKQRCVITAVEEAVSKTSGNPMIIVSVRPSGCRFTVKSYIVKNENFNRNMTRFFDAAPEIGDGNFDFLTWVGCEIGAELALDERGYLKVKWWLSPREMEKLPPFDGDKPEKQTVAKLEELDDDESDLPF